MAQAKDTMELLTRLAHHIISFTSAFIAFASDFSIIFQLSVFHHSGIPGNNIANKIAITGITTNEIFCHKFIFLRFPL